MKEQITLDRVLSSNTFVRGNSGVAYKTAAEYILPFLNRLNTLRCNFVVNVADVVKQEDKITGEELVAFPKVHIEALLPSFPDDRGELHTKKFGLVYNLDTQKPIIKFYTGFHVNACLNMSILGADDLIEQNLLTDYSRVYSKLDTIVQSNGINDYLDFVNELSSITVDDYRLRYIIGTLEEQILRNKLTLGTNHLGTAAKLMFDKSSKYYVGDSGKVDTNLWLIYNALTQSITNDSNIIDSPNKSLLAKELMTQFGVNNATTTISGSSSGQSEETIPVLAHEGREDNIVVSSSEYANN